MAVTVQVPGRGSRVYRGADTNMGPGNRRVIRYLVPAQVVLVRHGDDLHNAVPVHVGGENVVGAGEFFVEDDPLEGLAGAAWITVPRPARNEIEPAVVVHVEDTPAHVGRGVLTQEVARPDLGRLEFVIEDVTELQADDEFGLPVPVDVGQGGLCEAPLRDVGVDHVVFEFEHGRDNAPPIFLRQVKCRPDARPSLSSPFYR